MPSNIVELKDDEFSKLAEEEKMMVEFYAPWCGPCKILLSYLEKLSQEKQTVKFFKVNIEECPETCNSLVIRSVPTLIYFEKGKEVKRNSGSLNEQKVREMYM